MATQPLQLHDGRAVLSSTVTETVFGSIFKTIEEADDFVTFCRNKLNASPRALDAGHKLDTALHAWHVDLEAYPRTWEDEATTESIRRSSANLAVAQALCDRVAGRR